MAIIANLGKNTSVNTLTDNFIQSLFNLAKCNISPPRALTRHPSNLPPSSLPPSNLLVLPPYNVPIPNTSIVFKDTTKEPYYLEIYVLKQLYLDIGGLGCPFSTYRHSVLKIAQLIAGFLQNPKKKDPDLINIVQALLKEVKRITKECLGKS